MKPYKESTLPIGFESWDSSDTFVCQLYNVEFLEDFGPIQAGEKFDMVTIDYSAGYLDVWEPSEKGPGWRGPINKSVCCIKLRYVPESWSERNDDGPTTN